jgi:TnsA endonuclease N terminal
MERKKWAETSKGGNLFMRHSFKSTTVIQGSIPSKKPTPHMVHYRGLVQRAYIYLLEYDDQVQSYEEQPFSLSYHSGKQIAHYTPDFQVLWKHHAPRLVACVSQNVANRPKSIFAFTAARRWCQEHAYDFAVVTEVALHSQTIVLSNLEFLAIHAFTPIPPPTYEYLLKTILSIEGPFSPLELIQLTPLLHPFQTKSFLWNLVYHGELLTDLTQPLAFASTRLLWKGHRSLPSLSPPLDDISSP